jgi:hypothetical protein
MSRPRPPFNFDRPAPRKDFSDPLLTELEGCTALGMEKEALAMAGQIMRRPQITGAQFAAAVETLLIMVTRLRARRATVRKAYGRLTAKGQRSVRYWMLAFYHSAHDYEVAKEFIPRHFNGPHGFFELAWAWDIWCAVNDEKSLKKHFPTLATAASQAEHPYTKGLLLTCLGDYCILTRQWQLAVECFQLIPIESANVQQGIFGALLARSGELLDECKRAGETLNRYKQYHDPTLDVILPGNLPSQYNEITRQLKAFNPGLLRFLGKERLKQIERGNGS